MKHYVIRQKCGGHTLYLTTFNEWSPRQRNAIRMDRNVARDTLPKLCRFRPATNFRIIHLRPRRKP